MARYWITPGMRNGFYIKKLWQDGTWHIIVWAANMREVKEIMVCETR